MIQKLNQRRSALAALTQQHLDEIYDLVFQVYGEREASLAILQKILRTARRRYRFDRLERYARLWILRISVEGITSAYRHFLSEQAYNYVPNLAPLSLEEKLCVLLRDRLNLTHDELSSVMQLQAGRVGRSLVYGHEKLAHVLGYTFAPVRLTLPERVSIHLDSKGVEGDYVLAIGAARSHVAALQKHTLEELEQSVRVGKVLSILAQPKEWRWNTASWKTKLVIESLGFAAVGAIAVIAMPWIFSHINTRALMDGRFADVIQIAQATPVTHEEDIITAERLISAKDLSETEANLPKVQDEFSNLDFPSGDSYEIGSAPLAPSRQSAAVYRLIVQSPSPKEMIPLIRDLFAKRNVRERELSGRAMPGGVYFDGITTLGDYPTILKAVRELKQVGETHTYGDNGLKYRVPSTASNERARVIIWVQQI